MNERDVAVYVVVVYGSYHSDDKRTLYGPFDTLTDAEQWLSWSLPFPLRQFRCQVEPVLGVA